MSFSDISIYQVKPDHTEEFEAIVNQAAALMKSMEGCQRMTWVRRTHYIRDMETIRQGLPPDPITRIVKCVRYALYWEFDTDAHYGAAEKQLYETHWQAMEKCLIVPHDKLLGEVII